MTIATVNRWIKMIQEHETPKDQEPQLRTYEHTCYACNRKWKDNNPVGKSCPFCNERHAIPSKFEEWAEDTRSMIERSQY
jgi:hypothetical protein